jgi:hypothetical protein
MYSLTIMFGSAATPWQFLFKDKNKAESAYASINETIKEGLMARIVDDYGQTATIGSITGYLLEDLDLTVEARIQRTLNQAHGQAKYTERAKADPVLMRAAAGQRGPSVISPFANGQFQ